MSAPATTLLPLIERLGSAYLDEVPGITYRHAGEVRRNPPARAIEQPWPNATCTEPT